MDALSLRRTGWNCPQCLRPADSFECGDAGVALRILRCGACGDALVEASRCPLCDAPAERYALARLLFAVYTCSGGCMPFAFDSISEEQLRRPDYGPARARLRARVRMASSGGALHPLLVTGRIVDDVRRTIEDEDEAAPAD